jgi:hypothetical protein
VFVRLGVGVIIVGVFVTLGVRDGVSEGVSDGVKEGVSVTDEVKVGGMKGVSEIVLVGVSVSVVVGVKVGVFVFVAVPVSTNGVRLSVGVGGVFVNVIVEVTLGVRSDALGARAMASQPMQ